MSDILFVLEARWQESWEFFSFAMEARATLEALQNVDI